MSRRRRPRVRRSEQIVSAEFSRRQHSLVTAEAAFGRPEMGGMPGLSAASDSVDRGYCLGRECVVSVFLGAGRRFPAHALDALAPAHYRSAAFSPGNTPFLAADARKFQADVTRGIAAMSRRCELTGKTRQIGHKVSHSNRKTKRRFLPNLLNVTLISDALGRSVRLRVSANALKSVDHRGGLDAFLLKAKDAELSLRVLDLKRQVAKKQLATVS